MKDCSFPHQANEAKKETLDELHGDTHLVSRESIDTAKATNLSKQKETETELYVNTRRYLRESQNEAKASSLFKEKEIDTEVYELHDGHNRTSTGFQTSTKSTKLLEEKEKVKSESFEAPSDGSVTVKRKNISN